MRNLHSFTIVQHHKRHDSIKKLQSVLHTVMTIVA